LDLPSLQVNASMGAHDRGRLYLRDTGRYQPANSPSGAHELGSLSTDLLKPSLRFDFWSDVVCRTFTMLDCRTADRAGFRANLCSRSIAGISVARVDATASGVVRTADLIRSHHDDAHIVMLQISGVTRVRQGERFRMMSPGELDVVQADQPYVLDFPRLFSQYVIKLPRSAQPVGNAISATAGRFVRSLARDLLDPDIAPDNICDDVTARALQELLCGRPGEPVQSQHAPDLYGMAVAMIREKMFEPLLGRDRVAAELGVSVRTLARAFAMHGTTFDRSLWNCRLEAAHEALLSNRDSATVTEIALRHGFSDSSHFTRRFKQRFGATPGAMLSR
jgi:AraC family transcriptional regulator, positive regulator of tynA and feaB